MKKLLIFAFIAQFSLLISQVTSGCDLQTLKSVNILTVDIKDLSCIAKNADRPSTVFYTFTSWCAPCRQKMPMVLDLEKRFNAAVFVLIMESEQDKMMPGGIDFIRKHAPEAKILILKDEAYTGGTRKRNSSFIADISSKKKMFNPGYGVFIVADSAGKVLKVTDNFTDYRKLANGSYESEERMLEREVFPLLK
ncbi:hypothetical protein J8J42_05165 [Chryseobacterium sp. cx-311]|nr:hypothetical protein [Marnyiella aurantia]